MVIVMGQYSDLAVKLLIEQLEAHRIDFIFVDQARILEDINLNWRLPGKQQGYLAIREKVVDFDKVSGIFFRIDSLAPVVKSLDDQEEIYTYTELQSVITGFLFAFDCPVINRLHIGRATDLLFGGHDSMANVERCGFKVPPVIVTSHLTKALEFFAECNNKAAVSLPGKPEPIEIIDGSHGKDVLRETMRSYPLCLQSIVSGQRFRVYVVDTAVFADSWNVELTTCQSVDRKFNNERPLILELRSLSSNGVVEGAELADDIIAQSIRLIRTFDVEFAEIRLTLDEKGDLYCTGISSFPDLAHCSNQTRQAVVSALATRLSEASVG